MNPADHPEAAASTRQPGRSAALRRRALLSVLVAAFFLSFWVNPGLFGIIGVNHLGVWFLDTFALLASNDALTHGLDPYAPNPLDYFRRPHVYSHWWLHLRELGLTRAAVVWLGPALAIAFLAVALKRLRPQSPRQLLWYAGIVCSAPILLAVERGNNDLVIFLLLAPLVPCLMSDRRGWRRVAPWLVAAAAALKFYPAAAGLVLLATADRREMRERLVLTLLLLALVAVDVGPDLALYGNLTPKPEGLLSFGAVGLPNVLGWGGWMPKALVLLAGGVAVAVMWRRRWLDGWEPTWEQRSDWLHFILGAALLTGCFFTNRNFGYRWVFALWLAPLLWVLPLDVGAPDLVRRLACRLRWLLLAIFWWNPLCCFVLNRCSGFFSSSTVAELARLGFLAEQPLDWALFLGLLVFLTHFTQQSLRHLRDLRVA